MLGGGLNREGGIIELLQYLPFKSPGSQASDCQVESECIFPEDLQRREGIYLVFGAHFGIEKALQQGAIQCLYQTKDVR